jgi:hypothetical protein
MFYDVLQENQVLSGYDLVFRSILYQMQLSRLLKDNTPMSITIMN